MGTQHRHQLSRLHIPPSLNSQQPITVDSQAMFSPALPTALQHSYMPPFALNTPSAMQTPMQSSFFPHPPNAPLRPAHSGHRAYASIAQLAAAGIRPPPNMPITPLGQHQFPPQMIGTPGPFGQQHFVPKSRRTPSLGGPPKAPLGGPGRKPSPLPPAIVASGSKLEKPKLKKVAVKVPAENVSDSHPDRSATRSLWTRTPLHPSLLPEQIDIKPPELTTAESHPNDSSRNPLPSTIDVFLPGKSAWEEMKHRIIEEKLQKLGVERGTGSAQGLPEILVPHARAVSISSPADPALLFYKLNKLQQSQNTSLSNSLSTSPQAPLLTISPNQHLPPRFQNGHGHSMSLAPPSSLYQPPLYSPSGIFGPYEPQAYESPANVGVEQVPDHDMHQIHEASLQGLYAPQGRVPVPVAALNIPSVSPRPDSRPDFIRGFGLDIPEEEEEIEEIVAAPAMTREEEVSLEQVSDIAAPEEDSELVYKHDAVKTGVHTRHASRVSVALSLGSVNRATCEPTAKEDKEEEDLEAGEIEVEEADHFSDEVGVRDPDLDQDAVGEWTGSEDLRSAMEVSDDESIGEWSNPSDEERARQQRVQRRVLRRTAHELEIPRRLPNFPRPPDALFVPVHPDDDIISNPSEEEAHHSFGSRLGDHDSLYNRPSSNSSGRASRPLPPLPHSRDGSGHFSYYDPALAHSRRTSDQFAYPTSRPGSTSLARSASRHTSRRDSLNPLAKPFVFGSRTSGSWAPGSFGGSVAASSQHASSPGHSRLPSLGSARALNAAAQEFKPTGFTFRPPPGVPELTFPEVAATDEASRPLPDLPVNPSPARAVQGREKRQRVTGSPESDIEEEENTRTSMTSFRFPAGPDSPSKVRRSAPTSPKQSSADRQTSLNAAAKPFTFSGFSNLTSAALPFVPGEAKSLPLSLGPNSPDDDLGDSITRAEYTTRDSLSPDLPMPQVSKQKRAPIPLDFKHPVSTNMVPAGLFKNLVNAEADERVRPAVRSRLESREVYEHKRQRSLDDHTVPAISHKASRGRLVTESDQRDTYPNESMDTDVASYISLSGRRSSLAPVQGATSSPRSGGFIVPPDLGRLGQMPQYEQRLEDLLDAKIDKLRRDLMVHGSPSDVKFISATTEEMVKEAMTMFRTQLHESAARGLDDSHADARGEMDFELIKSIVEQGHEESREMLQQDLSEIMRRIASLNTQDTGASLHILVPMLHELKSNLIGSTANVVNRLAAIEDGTSRAQLSHLERETLVYDLLNALAPHLATLRAEPIDYEALTGRLSQAVKPHISQLIDLASDKRETAGMIVDRIVPILRTLTSSAPAIDTDNLIAQLTTNVSRIVGPIDAHVITEQVADLVVERLDSRLAVRDMAMNADRLMTRMSESFTPVLERVNDLSSIVESLGQGQEHISSGTRELSSIHKDVVSLLSDLPARLTAATDALGVAQGQIQLNGADGSEQSRYLAHIETSVDSLTSSREALSSQTQDLLSLSRDVHDLLCTIPASITGTTQLVQTAHTDILARLNSNKQETDEFRKIMMSNTDLQVQLAKARGSHGQVRVEKDNLNDRLASSEAERDRLRGQVDELQSMAIARAAEHAALQSRTTEQEQAMHTALERLKTSDVIAQSQQERIAELEKANRDLVLEKQQWKSKVETLEMQVDFGVRDKAAVVQALNLIQSDRDHLAAQQGHWEDLRSAAENIETLTKLIGQVDTEEVKELKRARDRGKALEGEHAALQKRFKDQESKIVNIERASTTARQSLAAAQQRSTEWERKAREFEGELERTTTRLDQSEQTRTQLEADYSLAKLQLEEREAEARLSKDRERKTHEVAMSFEAQIAQLRSALDEAKRAHPASSGHWGHEGYSNGNASRSSSRASTTYGTLQTPRLNGQSLSRPPSIAPSSPPPHTSTWDSIHAPKKYIDPTPATPRAARHSLDYRASAPSPTPSTVSLAPTQGDDGWWS